MKKSLFAILVVTLSIPAWAHGELGGGKGMLSGATHYLTSPLALAAWVGMVVTVFAVHEKQVPALVISSAVAAALGAFGAEVAPSYLAAVLVVAIGLAGVFALRLTVTAAVLFAVITGFTSGLASELEPPTLARALGVAVTQAALVAGAHYTIPELHRVARLQPFTAIARRVLGSWVTAIGMLMTALAIHSAKL